MRKKSVKKLKKLAAILTYGKPEQEAKLVYNKLKATHKFNKGER